MDVRTCSTYINEKYAADKKKNSTISQLLKSFTVVKSFDYQDLLLLIKPRRRRWRSLIFVSCCKFSRVVTSDVVLSNINKYNCVQWREQSSNRSELSSWRKVLQFLFAFCVRKKEKKCHDNVLDGIPQKVNYFLPFIRFFVCFEVEKTRNEFQEEAVVLTR